MNQEMTILSESDQRWRNEIIAQLAKEARIPIQRAMMTEWNQIEANKYRTKQGREVELSNMLVVALDRLPCSGRYVFSLSPFPPTIPDEWLDPARKYIEKKHKLAFHKR